MLKVLKTSLRHVGSVESLLDNYIPDEMKVPKSKRGLKKRSYTEMSTETETQQLDNNPAGETLQEEQSKPDGGNCNVRKQHPQPDDVQDFIDKMLNFTLASSSASNEEYIEEEECPEYGILDPVP